LQGDASRATQHNHHHHDDDDDDDHHHQHHPIHNTAAMVACGIA